MTCSTSLVAVWYWSDSSRSLVFACTASNRRALPMAITAWSAKLCRSSRSRSVNAPRDRATPNGPDAPPFPHHRRERKRVIADDLAHPAQHPRRLRIVEDVRIMHDAPLADRAPGRGDIDRRRERRRYCLVRLADIGGDLQQTVIVDQQYIKLVAAEQPARSCRGSCRTPACIGHRVLITRAPRRSRSAAPAPRASR